METYTPNQRGLTRVISTTPRLKKVYSDSLFSVRVNGETQQGTTKVLRGYETQLTLSNGEVVAHDFGRQIGYARMALTRLLDLISQGRVAINTNNGNYHEYVKPEDLTAEIEKGVA
jgi:hypothetical protein